jgi:hypothetical protein
MRLQRDQSPNKAHCKVHLGTQLSFVYIYVFLQSILGFQLKLFDTSVNFCLAHTTSIPLLETTVLCYFHHPKYSNYNQHAYA